MFCNEAGTSAHADIIEEQVAGSLRELQEEVEVLEDVLNDMVFIMGQKEKQRRRGGKSFPAQTIAEGVPKGRKNRHRPMGSGGAHRGQEYD